MTVGISVVCYRSEVELGEAQNGNGSGLDFGNTLGIGDDFQVDV